MRDRKKEKNLEDVGKQDKGFQATYQVRETDDKPKRDQRETKEKPKRDQRETKERPKRDQRET